MRGRSFAQSRFVSGFSRDILDLSIGNTDIPAPREALRILASTPFESELGYCPPRGTAPLRSAACDYYARRFDVSLDPDSEVLVTLGSKDGYAHLAGVLASPGCRALVPCPFYPGHRRALEAMGAIVETYPVDPTSETLARILEALERRCDPARILVLSYPSNPTGHVASRDFFEPIVAAARRHRVTIVSDVAYAELYYDSPAPPSLLSIDGAREIAVEFSTMSKSFGMAGARVGFAAGNAALIEALARRKSVFDYGGFAPTQAAAAVALACDPTYHAHLRVLYRRRRDLVVGILKAAGWDVRTPEAGMFVWVRPPQPAQARGSQNLVDEILDRARVRLAPGCAFSPDADDHLRIALVADEAVLENAIRKIIEII